MLVRRRPGNIVVKESKNRGKKGSKKMYWKLRNTRAIAS